jgi:hypothetical protein
MSDMLKNVTITSAGYRLFSVFPDLQHACESVVKFVGFNFPGKKEALVHEMIADSFYRYESTRKTECGSRSEFILGLCARAYCLYSIRYSAFDHDGRPVVWTPMVQPVTEFEQIYKNIVVVNEPDPQFVSETSAQMQFGARILPGHLFAEVFKQQGNISYA